MDKYEYKVREEEIKKLITQGEYAQAAEIADTIDWRRVKSVMMLCTISDLYKINRRYEDARDMLLLAYERRPGGRNICYALCELYLKTEDIVPAVEYYKEFVQVAPKDPGRFILLYKIYEAQEVSLEERIEVLEELKKREYREKWAYELAYLYHRVGLETRCVEECDEMILWFGEGSYVIKAMELKMLHQPLSPEQQEKYDHRFEEAAETTDKEEEMELAPIEADSEGDLEDPDQMYEELDPDAEFADEDLIESNEGRNAGGKDSRLEEDTRVFEFVSSKAPLTMEAFPTERTGQQENPEELDIHVKTMDVGQYNTINLQMELAEGLKEILGPEKQETAEEDLITKTILAPMMDEDDNQENDMLWDMNLEEVEEDDSEEPAQNDSAENSEEKAAEDETAGQGEGAEKLQSGEKISAAQVEPPKAMAHVLSQETDGQISFVLPESSEIEKQITGQMSIEDILTEWERLKKENEEKRKEDVRQHVLQQTGNMFTEFEAAVRDGLLEQLEKSADEPQPEEPTLGEIEGMEELEAMLETEEARELEALEGTVETIEETAETEQPAEAAATVAETVEPEATAAETVEEISEIVQPAEAAATVAETVEPEAAVETVEETAETEQPAEAAATVAETVEPEAAAAETVEETAGTEDVKVEETESEESEHTPRERVRSMTNEEMEMYASYIQSKGTKEQIIRAVDSISLAAYTGNVIITGEEGMDTLTLAKNMIHEAKVSDGNFSGKTAKISGLALNKKNVEETLDLLQNGALIIRRASEMSEETVQELYRSLQRENLGIVVLLEDKKKAINRFLETYPYLLDVFTARVDVEALSNDELVAIGKQYAYEKEYSIDDFGVLALHTRIEELQTIDHAVTAPEVKLMVDEAIHHANRKTPGHFFDILLAKRYDEEDMIILTEKDFA